MKKIGILFGQETSFPQALAERINSLNEKDITAEFIKIDKVIQGASTDYAVIIDRVSKDIPFYQGYLKAAALNGAAVINNPFWWAADEKFFNNSLAMKNGINVPKTVLLPSNQHPPETNSDFFQNLAYPLDWASIFEYIGFPAYLKPFFGSGLKNIYQVNDEEQFFNAYNESGQTVMMLQEEIIFSDYFRCYCIDQKDMRIVQYDPKQPHQLRYLKNPLPKAESLMKRIHSNVVKINKILGYDFNTVEVAVKDGVPYAIDLCNPIPAADIKLVGEDNFEWIVSSVANMAVKRAKAYKDGVSNLTWGEFLKSSLTKN